MMTFSVAVTEASSRNTAAPCNSLEVISKNPSSVILHVLPRASRAKKWVSKRLNPMTSPPGGGKEIPPVLATIGPANRSEALMASTNCGDNCLLPCDRPGDVWIRILFCPIHSTWDPRFLNSSIMTLTSSIAGMLCNITGLSVSSVAAIQGRAAFLLPLILMLPFNGKPPVITYEPMPSWYRGNSRLTIQLNGRKKTGSMEP